MVKHTQKIRRQQPANCLKAFDHFMGLALKELRTSLTHFFPMFSFDPPKNVKTKGCLMFLGGSEESIGKRRVNQIIQTDFEQNTN